MYGRQNHSSNAGDDARSWMTKHRPFVFIISLCIVVAMTFLEINIGVAGISFVMLVVVHSTYSEKVENLRNNAIANLDQEALVMAQEAGQHWTVESRKKFGSLLSKYSAADQPRDWLKQATTLFLYSGLLAAFGILANLAEGIPTFNAGLFEASFAFFSAILLIWAAIHTFRVIQFVSSPIQDPELPSLPMILGVAAFQFFDVVWLYLLFQSYSSLLLWAKIFLGTLIASLVAGFLLILRLGETKGDIEKVLEMALLISPAAVLLVVIVLAYLHVPLI